MPPRPTLLLLRPIAIARPPRTCHACLRRTRPSSPPRRIQTLLFHTTSTRWSDNTPNHYETLQLTSAASAADVKRQFYTLSKKHHPDRNPDDPTASTRFVAISEAYHVLSIPEKRAQYDAQLQQSQSKSRWEWNGSSYPQGSHSSASFGARPASGLNKKRSTFRGPPPSFFKAGGYGQHGAKRAEYAYHGATEGHEGNKQARQESYGEWGGFGPGQQRQGHEVPHFDDRRHKEMHDNVNNHIYARRHRTQRRVHVEEEFNRGGMLANFLMVSGIIGMIGITAKLFGDGHEGTKEGKNTGKWKEEA
ncbi:DnaJ-domain-containing protein [Cucurbitaria berberidis CBS 394.84]|uniref:DnaJ-domain-containing protein n=1 Tax=Cucurbitaria berberidis CBS 394.84 TaxID=1168544 RepID=A0A9P4LBQ7_9PLEO|nr:DnaJ-domain-containing protein [Cucurbitaria berberidis CBS 394.84]KAF1849861.1 DnaJ-domain-containing protein [Cucurbitaria berberidis CBS 394.84]